MALKNFKELIVWQKSHVLVLEIYKITKLFPSEEKFGLISQLRKSAGSVPTNIVEGNKRKSTKDYVHFLNVAESSLEETKYQLLLCRDLSYIDDAQYDKLTLTCDEIGKMLFSIQKKLSTPYPLSLTPADA